MKKYINSLLAGVLGGAIVLAFAATSYDMQKGIDLTGQSSVSASMLNQLVDNSIVAANRGMIIYTNSAPTASDVTANPRLARFIWLDSSQNPPAIYTWNTATTNWVGSGIASNSITSAMIVDGTIASVDIANTAIQNSHLDNNIVQEANISADSINTTHMKTDSVVSSNILDGTIALVDMALGAVNSATIYDESILASDIATGAVDSDELAVNSVINTKVATDAIRTTNIVDDAVSLAKLDSGAISAFQVLRGNSGGTAYEAVNQAVLQYKFASTTNGYDIAGTTYTHNNDTPVTSAMGAEITELAIAFTPKSTNSTVIVDFDASGTMSAHTVHLAFTIFRDSESNPVSLAQHHCVSQETVQGRVRYIYSPGSTSTVTFKARIMLSAAGTFYLNKTSAANSHGSVHAATMTVQEVQ